MIAARKSILLGLAALSLVAGLSGCVVAERPVHHRDYVAQGPYRHQHHWNNGWQGNQGGWSNGWQGNQGGDWND